MWSNSKQWLSHRIGWLDSRRLILSTEPRPLYRSCTSHHDQSSTASQTLLLSSNADSTLIWLGLLSSEVHWNLNLDSTPTKPWPFLLRCSRILPVHIFYLIVVFCLTTHVSCAGLGVLWAAEAVWQWMEVVRGSHHSRGLWEWSHQVLLFSSSGTFCQREVRHLLIWFFDFRCFYVNHPYAFSVVRMPKC